MAMPRRSTTHSSGRRAVALAAAAALAIALVPLLTATSSATASPPGSTTAVISADGAPTATDGALTATNGPVGSGSNSNGPVDTGPAATSLIRVIVPNQAAIDSLLAEGYDLVEYRKPADGGFEVNIVATAAEQAALQGKGLSVIGTVSNPAQVTKNRAERSAVLTAETKAARLADTLTPLRAEWFTSTTGQTFLSVEVKTNDPTAENILTVAWNGGSSAMDRFVDDGEYMYHRFNTPIAVSGVPKNVLITSTDGAHLSVPVTKWLGQKLPNPPKHYVSDFVDHYMDPTQVYGRITKLAGQFGTIADVIDLPYKTNGYRRAAQAQFGTAAASTFYVTSKAYGSEGGNGITVSLANPGTSSWPLSVAVNGKAVLVTLGTDAGGTVSSTAASVVAALNTDASVGTLLTASTYRGNAGTGLVAPSASTTLTDNLKAPATVSRDPFQMKALRIGKTRDGSKPGVFLYCQEHAREWVTPLVCVETAERLLRNYATDPATKKLVDNLDIFIVPVVNPDGAHYSFYDYNFQRKNMTDYCDPASSDPGRRNSWGVDLNRNFTVGSAFDGFVGASTTNCLSGSFTGPAELSEPEAKNEVWLTEQYPNIKFAMNTHSYGGYFMWPPGAYKAEGRVTLPRPDLGTEEYFWASSSHILSAVQDYRGTAIWPGYTGPVIDVLYSAAGNSADEVWYNRGIIGWDFEVGADLWNPQSQRWEGVGFQPDFSEGHEEAMEFANGQIGILDVALAYGKDHKAPHSKLVVSAKKPGYTSFSFTVNEPATVYYTLDGSRPDFTSPSLQAAGTREPPQTLTITADTTVNWFSADVAGNIEKGYVPSGTGDGYNSKKLKVKKL